jgi:hypothetical protein
MSKRRREIGETSLVQRETLCRNEGCRREKRGRRRHLKAAGLPDIIQPDSIFYNEMKRND